MTTMDTFQPPPPLLPDLVTSPSNNPIEQQTTIVADNCSSGFQSTNSSSSTWPPTTPCSSSSFSMQTTTFNDYAPPQTCTLLPPPPSPPQPTPMQGVSHQHHQHHHQQQQQQQQVSQPLQLPDIVPAKVVEEFEEIMSNENDKVVLTNSICLLFRFSIDNSRGLEVCRAMSASPDIMNRLYYVLLNEQFKDDDLILCYATGNLTNISKYDEGRAAILGCTGPQFNNQYLYTASLGVQSLIRSLQSRDNNVVIFAITAIHNLLLDRRVEIQEIAKQQIKHGLASIVQLLGNQCLIHNYEFKVIVLDCLQILAYGNRENRLAIKRSGGPYLLLHTIKENFDNQPTEELIETASRVLKSLSACPENKLDIIKFGGINILTGCIKKNNQEILKTCLWTLRNLSDVINNSEGVDFNCIDKLVERLLEILQDYSEEPCIVTCALGILANLTCNNELIKQFICQCDGINLLLNTIEIALNAGRDFRIVDKEILEPAVCALCHLMNQNQNPDLAELARRSVKAKPYMFDIMNIHDGMMSDDLSKAVTKLINLIRKQSV